MNALRAAERLTIAGPAGDLQAVAESSIDHGTHYAVICHPHPLFGGTMDNKVVTTVARGLQDAGVPTLRFNFRGVGASAGAFDEGTGETADAAAAISWGVERWPGRSLVLAGFSFGGYVALRAAQNRENLAQLITIAPAIEHFDVSALTLPPCPWLIIQGDADDVVDPNAVIKWVHGFSPNPNLIVLEGVGHFFHGRLHDLRDAVIGAIGSG